MNRRQFIATTAASSLAVAFSIAETPKRWRVGVIGHTGRGDYGHGLDTMWLKLPETEIVAVADANPKGQASSQTKLSLPPEKVFADYKEMLAKEKPDIVSIGPRSIDQHREMVLAAVQGGARGIYMEKPFCRTPAEADEIVAACDKAGVKLSLAHRNRFHPVLPVLKKLIDGGAIGQFLEVRTRGKEDHRGGSLDLWVLGSHVLNLATYFCGRPLSCSAAVLKDRQLVTKADIQEGTEGVGPLAGNEVHARFEMEDGLPVFFDSVAKAGVKEAGFGLQLIGTKGIIDLRIDTEPLAHILEGSPFRPINEARAWKPISTAGIAVPEPIPDLGKQVGGHLTAAKDLIAAIQENRQPLCSAAEGAVTVEMICGVFESHRQGGQRVALPLKDRGNPLALL